jgi:hypothetical protein
VDPRSEAAFRGHSCTLRFTHAQIAYEPRYVRDVIRAVAARAAAG